MKSGLYIAREESCGSGQAPRGRLSEPSSVVFGQYHYICASRKCLKVVTMLIRHRIRAYALLMLQHGTVWM